jgi:saccharopine dehydrogenase-like NADP-dependent oxidoreductase
MNTILVLGAGRSSSSLIKYLLEAGAVRDWQIKVGDVSDEAARQRIAHATNGSALRFDIHDEVLAKTTIASADVVISLLPANLHPLVAKMCLSMRKHFLNASYVSDEIKSMHDDAMSNDLLFLNECGLDPGIDHMSAMRVIDAIKNHGGELTSFESFTGGLIAPETDPQNPWRYKFTWNPRNVVMAGQGTAKYLLNGEYKYIPYQQLFKRTTPVSVLDTWYEGYPNRDSLKYLSTYGLDGIKTMIRGTLRNAGYCDAWNVLVQLGCCDDTYEMEGVERMTHHDFISAFLMVDNLSSAEESLCSTFKLSANGEEMRRLSWSGLFSKENVGLKKGTPAQVLEHILNKKWKLSPGDKDFIVMWHQFGYLKDGVVRKAQSYMTVKGDDEIQTAMANTVGLPLAIACKLLLEGKIKERGVVIPIKKEIYEPVLSELKDLGIEVTEQGL